MSCVLIRGRPLPNRSSVALPRERSWPQYDRNGNGRQRGDHSGDSRTVMGTGVGKKLPAKIHHGMIRIPANTLFPVLLKSQTRRIRVANMVKHCQAIQDEERSACPNVTTCHAAYTEPRITLAPRASHLSCIESITYPSQPNSSPKAAIMAKKNMKGARRMASAYQTFALIRPKSNDLLSSPAKPAVPLLR